ncbi:protein-glutamate methylesterase/protein-glutamine glutaminase [Brevibacillus dissolubilis]|uniref:protein-glutamate methylesterase/protein-glutamine glutaminase n=1 Tax=Brevibacillus dissolubilis TaxID=1844116 RepID=UPI0011166A7B|nr:chemotaxis response regulator protein-glutamate methylesterase [Brevibacillus dissolubilis]
MSKIRVLVVDDSAFMRKVISDILSADAEVEVIDKAKNGKEAIEKVKNLQPDVVTLDIEMPEMNGLEALEYLMKHHPVPVVMLSSLTMEGAEATIRALELGAFDFVTKTSGPISLDIHKVGDTIVDIVKQAAKSKRRIGRGLGGSSVTNTPAPAPAPQPRPSIQKPTVPGFSRKMETPADNPPTPVSMSSDIGGRTTKIVALGTSTGGPKALQVVLSKIPADFNAPILIVQHMPPGFTKSLAQRLDTQSPIRVCEAEDGQTVENGTAYIAPGGYHMEVAQQSNGRLKIKLQQDAPRGGHRPSVDVLFESVSKLTKVNKWAVIMTGMGSDGTNGLKQLKASGTVTSVIEHESSCVVYGMPRAAVNAGLADNIVPLEHIAETLVRLVN